MAPAQAYLDRPEFPKDENISISNHRGSEKSYFILYVEDDLINGNQAVN